VAAAFGCAVFALQEWGESRRWPYALLALILATLCTQLKIPGLIMGGIVLIVFLTSVIKLAKRTRIALLVTIVLSVIYMAAIGIDFSLPNIGRIALSPDGIVLPYIGRYELAYHPIHAVMIDTIFLMLNWNILWYLFSLLTVIFVLGRKRLRSPSLDLRALSSTLLFIFFVYYFTNRYEFALDFTQVNRALIYSIPPMVFYLFNNFGRWQTPSVEAE